MIDGATNQVIAKVPTGSVTEALCFDLTSNKVYCAGLYSESVAVIDGATNSNFMRIGVDMGACAFAWNPIQDRVYVANSGGSSISVIRDVAGVEEGHTKPDRRYAVPIPTVVRGVLEMPLTAHRQPLTAGLLDIAGREVLRLHPGANDVSRLAPGVYFVREEPSAASRQPSAIWKIILTK